MKGIIIAGGFGSGGAVLIGDSLDIPGIELTRRLIPPPTLLWAALGRTNLPIGRLPGDILYRGKHTTFYFPLATSIVMSVVLSLVLYLVGRIRH